MLACYQATTTSLGDPRLRPPFHPLDTETWTVVLEVKLLTGVQIVFLCELSKVLVFLEHSWR